MFYCQPCADERGWPEGWSKSRGPCELCGEVAICSDCPSSSLPLPLAKEFPSLYSAPKRRECGSVCKGRDPSLCQAMSDCCTLPEASLEERRAADAAH